MSLFFDAVQDNACVSKVLQHAFRELSLYRGVPLYSSKTPFSFKKSEVVCEKGVADCQKEVAVCENVTVAFEKSVDAFDKISVEKNVFWLECELLLAHVLELRREDIFMAQEKILDSEQLERFFYFFQRLKEGEPLAYIINTKEFYGLSFYVDDRVMIPRPETEMLVETLKELHENRNEHLNSDIYLESECRLKNYDCLKSSNYLKDDVCLKNDVRLKRDIKFVDIGTGSGNLAIALAHIFKNAHVLALDVSKDALDVASMNVRRFGLENRVLLRQNDLLSGFADENFDAVVANLPYIGTEKYHFVSDQTKRFEPHLALFGGSDGLECYRRLFLQITQMKIRPRYVLGEIGFLQGEGLRTEAARFFPEIFCEIRQDLAGLDRMFVLKMYP
ncbi:peptide chain release factor N(5)-glutamine methyltransferase [Candidatus Peregrinibacteria bacterium]|nr:peptide chain release factor N(5)-glutamine methyltransferase [Candidatus Peregrinibacteria bacterium]